MAVLAKIVDSEWVRPADDDRNVDAEVLDVGDPDPQDGAARRRPRWPLFALAGLAVLVAAVALHGGGLIAPRAASGSSPTSPSTPSMPSTPSTESPSGLAGSASPGESGAADPAGGDGGSPRPAVQVVETGHPLFGGGRDWELFGRSDSSLVRIEPASGRVTTTAVNGPMSGVGRQTLLVFGSAALVDDSNSGSYVVRDGEAARSSPADLAAGGPIVPGPDLSGVWVRRRLSGTLVLALVGLDGRLRGTTLPYPPDALTLTVSADGAGYPLLSGLGGVYDVRADGLHRITSGGLLAVGPGGWLTVECDDRHACHQAVVQRSGERRNLPGPALQVPLGTGRISADGRTAAVISMGTGVPALVLVDLTSGRQLTVDLTSGSPLSVAQTSGAFQNEGGLAWSPDSTTLFALDAGGGLHLVDPRTGAASDPGITVDPLQELAIRYPVR